MYVCDLEGNGLLDNVTVIHCGVFIDTETNDCKVFEPNQIQDMLKFMASQKILIGHNILGYDLPALKKLYGFEFKGTVVDTLVMSRLLCPDRLTPPSVAKSARELGQRIPGPHSVASWGYTLGLGKLHHEDWSTYSEEMRLRCLYDTTIQVKLFKHLRNVMTEIKFPQSVMNRTFKVFKILNTMEQYGWLFDKVRAERSCSLLKHWMHRIERMVDPLLPVIAEAGEVKKDGQTNWVRKPFLMSGQYAAITLRSFPELEGKSAKTGFVAGQFSRVRFRKMDINSRNEMVQFLLDSGWIPREWNYQTDDNGRVVKDLKGNPITTSPKLNYKDPFDGVTGTAGQLIAKWVQCRHRLSLVEGLIQLVRPDGRISQRITGIADTGRLTHGGIVNIPGSRSFFGNRIRSLFIARKGYKLVGTDSVSCQDRALANRANNEEFTQMLLNGDKSKGTDGHSLNMHAINKVLQPYGVSISRDDAKNHGYGLISAHVKLGELLER